MPQGLQIWDSAGVLIFDTSHDIGQILGITSIASASGSVSDARLSVGRPFWWYMADASSFRNNQPSISVAAGVLSWSWPVGGGVNGRILYGVY